MFFLQLILAVIIITIEIKRDRKQLVDVLAIFNLIYFICYVVAPISGFYMMDNWQKYSIMRYTFKGINYVNNEFYYTGLLTIVCYVTLIVSYSFFKARNSYKFLDRLFSSKVSKMKLYKLGIFFFFVAFIFLAISSINFGGFMKWMIANSRLHNVNDAEGIESNSWFFDKAIRLMVVSSYIFWGILKIESKKFSVNIIDQQLPINRFILYGFLSISILLSIAVVIHSGGRLFFFQYVAVFVISDMYLNRKSISLKKILFLVSFGILVALFARTFFQYFINENAIQEKLNSYEDTYLESYFGFINNYTFPFYAANHNLTYPFVDFNFFTDMFTWPLQFLPPSIRPDNLPDSTAINTFRLLDLKNTRFIPSDILSYGIINGGVVGVVIVGYLFGIVLRIVNNYSYKLSNPVSVIIFVALAFIIGFRVMYFDPYHLFKGSFEFFLGLYCLYICNRSSRRSFNNEL